CEESELKELIPILDFIYRLHDTAVRIGLLGIYEEHDPDGMEDRFFRAVLTLVLDGWSAENLEKFVSFEISRSRETGVDLLRKMIIRDGCLSLIKGNTPRDVKLHFERVFFNRVGK
ncbi:MAG: hypothetical protein PQJ58_18515, partial [Spirochaetales bacterium]|nr:hypothetical protein [Spirochaetales bacterium]